MKISSKRNPLQRCQNLSQKTEEARNEGENNIQPQVLESYKGPPFKSELRKTTIHIVPKYKRET